MDLYAQLDALDADGSTIWEIGCARRPPGRLAEKVATTTGWAVTSDVFTASAP